MSLVYTGWLIDCLAAIFIAIIIGYLISIKFKTKRKLIITLFVLLAIILPTINLYKNLKKEESTQAAKVTPTKTTATKKNKQKKYTKTDLENFFDQIVKKSNDSIFDVGYVQQGDVIEVDVQLSKTGWVPLNDADKKKMVSDLGKGFELVIKNSELYTADSHIYVFFYGVHSNDEIANYEDNRVTIIQTKTDNIKAKQGNTVTNDFRSLMVAGLILLIYVVMGIIWTLHLQIKIQLMYSYRLLCLVPKMLTVQMCVQIVQVKLQCCRLIKMV